MKKDIPLIITIFVVVASSFVLGILGICYLKQRSIDIDNKNMLLRAK